MGFLSNVIYWRESGYFDAASHEKWLLHTWSLSVEWQFYIIYPIVLVALKRFLSLENVKRLIVVGTVLGFGFSVVATIKWPNAAYYLLPTRAWEMMMGGVAFLYPWSVSDAKKKALEISGLLLILTSYAFVSSDTPWPGHFALIPIIGSYLMIVANRQSSVITNNKVFQCLGKWSYSIYLWHWPIVVLGYYFNIESWYLYGLPLSVILGFMSFRFIEIFKFQSFSQWFDFWKIKLTYMTAIIFLLGCEVYLNDGHNSIDTTNNEMINKFPDYPEYCHIWGKNIRDINVDSFDCVLNPEKGDPKVLMWGDSYAGALDPFVQNVFRSTSVTSRTTSACFPSLDNNMLGGQPELCRAFREKIKSDLDANRYDVVFMAGRWEMMYRSYQENGLNSLFSAIDVASKSSKVVYVFAQPVLYEKNIYSEYFKVVNGFGVDFKRKDEQPQRLNALIESFITDKNYHNVYFIGRDLIYGGSDVDYTPDGLPFTFDQGHLNIHGSLTVSENFKKSKLYRFLP
jgi:hypothetical protein